MKFPIRYQLESVDCGPTCIQMLASFYGKDYLLSEIKEQCSQTRLGVSLNDMIIACNKIGLKALPVQPKFKNIKDMPLPAILFWRQEHFVVLYKIKKGRYYIADPGYGKIVLDENSFLKDWLNQNETGIALVVAPTAFFYKRHSKKYYKFSAFKSIIKLLIDNLFTQKRKFCKLSFLAFIMIAFTWLMPYMYQQIIDQGIGEKDMNKVILFALLQFSFFIGYTIANNIINVFQTKLGFNIGVNLLTKYLNKLAKLPISFFDIKLNTDLIQRIDDQSRIESFLAKTLTSVLFAIINIVVYLFILGFYNILILAIFLVFMGCSFFYFNYFFKKRKIIDYTKFSINAENKSRIYELINGMTDIKINNAQSVKINQWKNIHNDLNKINLKSLYIDNYIALGNILFDKVKDIIISIGCAYFVITGSLSVGIMMTITYLLGQLSSYTSQLVRFFQELQNTQLAYQRLNDIFEKKDENVGQNISLPVVTNGIIFENVFFRYPGNLNGFSLNNINVVIPKGKITAIVGDSGSGKTTLLKLLLAFYHPYQGNIFLDKEKMTLVNSNEWRNKCGVVMQDGYIYSGTIVENIALSDEFPDILKVKKAAQISCISDFIEELPMKYNTKIGRNGINLSGGQKQRLLIARAVYKNPEFIFLDEATSSLDANNEKKIMKNLNDFYSGRTVVIIAHRLSTVKNSDNIIYMEKGKIIEQGTHRELISLQGAYYNLVKNQLELEQ